MRTLVGRTLLVTIMALGGLSFGQSTTGGAPDDLSKYLAQTAKKISETSLQVQDLRFEVRDARLAAAYVEPAATVVVTRRALDLLNTESELIGLLCHQVAHLRVGLTAVSAVQEKQADFWTVRCVMALGYDPRGIIAAADVLQQAGSAVDGSLATHLVTDRKKEIEQLINSSPADQVKSGYVIDSYRFHKAARGASVLPEELVTSKLKKERITMPELTREDIQRALEGREWTLVETRAGRSYSVKDPGGMVHLEARPVTSAEALNRPAISAQNEPKYINSGETVSSMSMASPSRTSTAFVLEDATAVKLRLMENVSSSGARVGDTVPFEVLEEIRIGDTVVIPLGAPAWASVTEAERKKRMGRAGKLAVSLDAVRLANGQKAALRAVQGGSGGGHVGKMTGAIVATAIVFWPAAPLFLFMSGKDKTIPKGTTITAYINGNIPLDWNAFHPDVVKERPNAHSEVAEQVDVKVSSNPDNAEIELNGSFVGSTPSTLSLAPGEYTIQISRKGHRPWSKKIRVVRGAIQVSAELEKEP
jgi:hypothetical protein